MKNINRKKVIYVTQPALPPLVEYIEYLKQIWDSKIVTNIGPFHKQLENDLAKYLGVKYISLFSNGTLALITALQVLKITGEVITTPFSFIATTHALWWNNIKPVFVDIEPEYLNLDPGKIEMALTPQTSAILPVHVYGNPCNVEKFQKIAAKHNLKLIYDAAHAFGVKINGESVLKFGDLAVLSFHATKVFSTIEGGAIVCHDKDTKQKIDYLKNFGFADEVTVVGPGINAKMNEIQASFGLLQLKYIESYISKRKKIAETYRKLLKDIKGVRFLNDKSTVSHSYTYFPIFINSEEYGLSRDEIYLKLQEHSIYGRRYFYPLISQFPVYRELLSAKQDNLPVATEIAGQVICLPIFPSLKIMEVLEICEILKKK